VLDLIPATLSPSIPIIPPVGCVGAGVAAPVCVVAGVGGSLASGAADAVLSGLATWVVNGAAWLLQQMGGVISSTTSITLGAPWFVAHYQVMGGIAVVVVLPMLLASVIQAIYRQSAGILVRVALVQLPLALLLTAVVVQLTQLALSVTDALSVTVAGGTGGQLQQTLSQMAAGVTQIGLGTGAPAFALFLGALMVALGAFALWGELLVRAAAVYAAVLFLPLALASMVWPAVSHWCRRLLETLTALILSKFVIVSVLSLAVAGVAAGANGSGFAGLLGAGALLLLATFTPFVLLRLVPLVEAGAVHQLEGARRRVQHEVTTPVRSAATFALGHVGGQDLASLGRPGSMEPGPSFDAPGGPSTANGDDAHTPKGARAVTAPPGSGTRGGTKRHGRAVSAGSAEPGGESGPDAIPVWRGVPPPGGEGQVTAPGAKPALPLWVPGDADDRPEGDPDEGPVVPPKRVSLDTLAVDVEVTHDEMGPVLHFVRHPFGSSGPPKDRADER